MDGTFPGRLPGTGRVQLGRRARPRYGPGRERPSGAGNVASGAAGQHRERRGGNLGQRRGGEQRDRHGGERRSGAAGTSAGGAGGGGTPARPGRPAPRAPAARRAAGARRAPAARRAAGARRAPRGAGGRGGTTGTGGAGRGGTGGARGARARWVAADAAGRRRGGPRGATGTGGANSCPAGGRLDCTGAGSLELTPDGQIVDFSAAQWNNTTSRFCDAHGLDGGLSSFAGTGSTAAAAVDTTARNLKLNFMVTAGEYAGGRVNFDSCVDASGFNSIQFTASVTAGSLTGCAWQVQLQTQNQRPTTLTNPMGGTCNATTTTCERYPAATLTAPTATATTFTVRFTAFNNPAASTIATPSQIVGLQWQVNSNNGSGACTVELRIDNVRFVTQ